MSEESCKIEQYRIYIDYVHKTAIDRTALHKFYSYFIAMIAGAIGAILINIHIINTREEIIILILCIAAIKVCSLWQKSISNYIFLSKKKFPIIHRMEEDLPFKPFQIDWASRNGQKNLNVKKGCFEFCQNIECPSEVKGSTADEYKEARKHEISLPVLCSLPFKAIVAILLIKWWLLL